VFASTVRAILFVGSALVALAGLIAAASGVGAPALWFTVTGTLGVVVLAIERGRYRSDAAEAGNEPVGPGGGEPDGVLEPRFQRTEETFLDPTTRHVMRVHIDPRTGERRYVAEG
jgi:hypothetical protein